MTKLAIIILTAFLFINAATSQHDLAIVDSSYNVNVSEFHAEQINHSSPFEATNDWKTIEPGQAIPPGLHVRINLSTGKKEAKLLDNNAESDIERESSNPSTKYDRKDLEIFLKNIDKEGKNIEGTVTNPQPLDSSVKTDAEIVASIVSQLNSTKSESIIVDILNDLEYYLHQYDNGINFADMGGINLLLELFNSSSPEVRSAVGLVLGSAASSNPIVKTRVADAGFIPVLIKCLHTESFDTVKIKCLFAAASILRNSIRSQEIFYHHGGLTLVQYLLSSSTSRNIQRKVLVLLYDLLLEKSHLTAKENLHTWQLCSTIQLLFDKLTKHFYGEINISDLEYLVDFVNVLNLTVTPCNLLEEISIIDVQNLKEIYVRFLMDTEMDDAYDLQLFSQLLLALNKSHEEL